MCIRDRYSISVKMNACTCICIYTAEAPWEWYYKHLYHNYISRSMKYTYQWIMNRRINAINVITSALSILYIHIWIALCVNVYNSSTYYFLLSMYFTCFSQNNNVCFISKVHFYLQGKIEKVHKYNKTFNLKWNGHYIHMFGFIS